MVSVVVSSAVLAAKRPNVGAWRTMVTPADRERLRNWRTAWVLALDEAQAAGDGPAIAREGVLLDPDAALEDPAIPDGDYACRTIKLGRKAAIGRTFTAYPVASCRIVGGRFAKLDGPQRPTGQFWPFDPTRLLFLGTMALSDEPRALDYGRDADRNMIGIVERIAVRRWRLVLPQPRWESQTDVIDLEPFSASNAASGVSGH